MDNTQKVFAVVSAMAGLGGLYFAWKRSNQAPPQINILPQLNNASYAPGQPTSDGASIPAFYASPFQITPDLVAQSTGAPQQVPYQQYNMPPTHVQRKKDLQTVATQSAPVAASCGCASSCGSKNSKNSCKQFGPRTNVPDGFAAAAARNTAGVGLRPVGGPAPPAPSIYSSRTSFNLATQQTVPAALAMSNQGVTLIGNVPSASDMIQ